MRWANVGYCPCVCVQPLKPTFTRCPSPAASSPPPSPSISISSSRSSHALRVLPIPPAEATCSTHDTETHVGQDSVWRCGETPCISGGLSSGHAEYIYKGEPKSEPTPPDHVLHKPMRARGPDRAHPIPYATTMPARVDLVAVDIDRGCSVFPVFMQWDYSPRGSTQRARDESVFCGRRRLGLQQLPQGAGPMQPRESLQAHRLVRQSFVCCHFEPPIPVVIIVA